MTISNIKDSIDSNIHKVWETVLAVDKYAQWRSDLSKTEVINEEQFIEYTKNGYPTTFTITVVEPHKRWEFDMENSNMKGHWVGIFTSIDDKTEIDFTEQVTAKKFYMKPFVKSYLKKTANTVCYGFKKNIREINPNLTISYPTYKAVTPLEINRFFYTQI